MRDVQAGTRARAHEDVGASRRPLVVAVGADGGMHALRAAQEMAAHESRPLVVVSIVESAPLDPEPVMALPWRTEEQVAERRRTVHDRLHQLGPAPFSVDEPEVVVRYGDPDRLIPAIALQRHAHVIVMGTGPHTLASRVLASETTLATIRHAPCPVLAVADGCVGPPRTVVVAMDFSPASLHAARQALPLLADGAVVHLVHAWRRYLDLVPEAAGDPRDVAYEHALPERFHRVRNVLGRERSLTFVSSVREGDAAAVILAAAREVRADLIVAGTRGHGLLERVVVGSVSTAILRGASCSVLVAPEPVPVERGWLERQMTGTTVVRTAEEWADELDAFARRNRARRTTLEIDGTAIGAQVQESGYVMTGATYDRRDHVVSLMFAHPHRADAHLTRTVGRVRSVAVSQGRGDRDSALCIECDGGSMLVTFLDGVSGGRD